jgi:hypothetical protein
MAVSKKSTTDPKGTASPVRKLVMTKKVRAEFDDARRLLKALRRAAKQLEKALKDAKGKNELGNEDIQGLMSSFNPMADLAGNVLKKIKDTTAGTVGNT